MNIDLNIRSFPDTMHPGEWVATVETHGPKPQGFFVVGPSEDLVLRDLINGLAAFLWKIHHKGETST